MIDQLDIDNAHRYAKLATRLLEKAQKAAARGEHTLAESRVENAKSFLARATRALVDVRREPAAENLRRHTLDYLLDPKTHEDLAARGWLKEEAPGVWVWDHEQMDRDYEQMDRDS